MSEYKRMSREILFRGKRVDNGEWIYGGYAKCNNREYILPDIDLVGREWVFKNIEVIPETVGQFTGLTDKNGKKVFEGDIVKITYNDRLTRRLEKEDYESYMKEFCLVEQVVFYKGAFCSKVEIENMPLYRPLGFDLYAKSMLKELEVIGNIYDNPELLEVEE